MTATPFTTPIQISSTEGDIYTAPAGGAIVQDVCVTSTHTVAVDFYLAVKVGATTVKWGGQAALEPDPGGSTSDVGAHYNSGPITLAGGAKIRAKASVDVVLEAVISGVELS